MTVKEVLVRVEYHGQVWYIVKELHADRFREVTPTIIRESTDTHRSDAVRGESKHRLQV